jgi:Ubiquitin-2 like Rad60 SUMO-like
LIDDGSSFIDTIMLLFVDILLNVVCCCLNKYVFSNALADNES